MSQEERYGTRDEVYSAWHRRKSTQRFVGIEAAQLLAMIDLDASLYVEYDDETKMPVAFIETARDVGQDHKSATVTKNLAKFYSHPISAYVLLYDVADYANPEVPHVNDIAGFRVKRLWPHPESEWTHLTPLAWAEKLLRVRGWGAKQIDELGIDTCE